MSDCPIPGCDIPSPGERNSADRMPVQLEVIEQDDGLTAYQEAWLNAVYQAVQSGDIGPVEITRYDDGLLIQRVDERKNSDSPAVPGQIVEIEHIEDADDIFVDLLEWN